MIKVHTAHGEVTLDNEHMSGQDLLMNEQALIIKEIFDTLGLSRKHKEGHALLEGSAAVIIQEKVSALTVPAVVDLLIKMQARDAIQELMERAVHIADDCGISEQVESGLEVEEINLGKEYFDGDARGHA